METHRHGYAQRDHDYEHKSEFVLMDFTYAFANSFVTIIPP